MQQCEEKSVVEEPILSKSTFLRGVQCQKSLALDALRPELRDPLDDSTRLRMRLGIDVGMQARERYPGGAVGRVPDSYAVSLQRTMELIQGGAEVIYEAAFEADGVRIVADIVLRGKGGWRLVEVKSTTEAKPEHLWDVAVQAYILRQSGLKLEDAALLHLNKNYVRQGELDYDALFAETSLLVEVDELQAEVKRQVEACKATLESGRVPEVPIGPHCKDPADCDFIGHCWKDLPSPSVFDVYYIGKRAYDLYAQGVERIEDIPPDHPLDKRSAFHVQAHKVGETIVKPGEIMAFLSELYYPLYYLDFETFALPIPPFDDLSPYAKVPFQYSLHVQGEPGRPLWHHGFLAEVDVDPRREFLDRLLEDTEGEGSIVVYYLPFERGVLKSLIDVFPERSEAIEARIERMVDLLGPFKRRAYWHPQMGGSNSLKQVLPVFAPDLSYDGLEIGGGDQAMTVFLNLAEQDDPAQVASLRQALWDYCKLDTLAMVRILDGLRDAAEA
jgi:CRISPR/Cas system-associated exonuclease Cas4 (RecB family)